ncbi:MAG TPA: TIGR03016 family PEP-CTERM system-associated outer membrane protein, partial [Dissulfurispiraceae bacterium]|nr:TIGR03016 family PEP-CTERM system-associated outer membrane protein [Dissulfurispiraceae bacterium]
MKKIIDFLIPSVFAMLILLCGVDRPGGALAADFKFEPSLTLSEEFNDNIYLTRTNRKSDFITGITPAARLLLDDPSLYANILGAYTYRIYARNTVQSNNPFYFNGLARAALISNNLYLEVSDIYQKVSLDPAQNFARESSFVNQTDSNVFTVHPYLVLRPTSLLT